MSRSSDLADIESGMLAMRGMNNTTLTAAKVLTDSETGFLLADATLAGFAITLPPSNRSMDVRVQRVDNSGNRLVIQASGAEKILFHTHLRAEGYPFFVLMGAGDFWHLRSDGNGNWRVLDRMDTTPLGRPVFETTTAFSPGGWVGHNGFLYSRAEWPWAWDHAQASGMLTTEALRAGNEGKWTQGDGVSTFRSPEGRGEFVRVLDEGRGIDIARTAGSAQVDRFQGHTHYIGAPAATNGSGVGARTDTNNPMNTYPQGAQSSEYANDGVNGTPRVGNETRPRNIAYPGRLKLI